MKKLIAILMAVTMLCTFSATAMAATAAVSENVLNWSDIEADIEELGIDADFVQLGDMNLMMWLPNVFSEQELTEEDVENGYLAYLTTDDESAVIAVMSVDLGESLEEWEKELPDHGVTDAEMGTVNGFQALMYSMPEDDCMCLDFERENGEILEFTFYPMSDEDFTGVASIIMMSLQPIE